MKLFLTILVCGGFLAGLGSPEASAELPRPTLRTVLLNDKANFNEKRAFLMSAAFNGSDWSKRYWLEKTARLLRNGHGLTDADDIEALVKMSREEVVDKFMSDARFADTVLDFNLFYLGFKLEDVRDGADFNKDIFSYSTTSAIAAAKEAMTGRDYFKIFDLTGDIFPEPLRATKEGRKRSFDKILATLDQALVKAKAAKDGTAICKALLSGPLDGATATFTGALLVPQRLRTVGPFVDAIEDLRLACAGTSNRDAMLSQLTRTRTLIAKLFAELLKFEAPNYHPMSVVQIQPLNLKAIGIEKAPLNFGVAAATVLRNSSTNINRKRSAYVLKRYFCDDLTPVGVGDASSHISGGPHGSDTSCYACHYKLDPMAGFFRNLGVKFTNFSRSQTITFDDDVVNDRGRYLDNWRATPDTGREWNVGYVRSTRFPEQNSYGESIEDLSRIIRQAPEAKRCLTKRLFEYFVGEDQTIDAGYLDSLAVQLTAEAASNSSLAFKNTIRRLVLSESFAQVNPDPNQCYDYGPGEDPATAPPCRVAFILNKNCAHCHGSSSGEGNLDLTHWITLSDGSKGFAHLDDTFINQMSQRETLAMIVKRLTSNNVAFRMPYKQDMPSQERQELYIWAQQQLTGMGAEVPK